MHEFPATQQIVADALARHSGSGRIARIRIAIGELTGFDPDCIAHYFPGAASGTAAAGALLEFTREAVQASCAECGAPFDTNLRALACPSCGGCALNFQGGRDVRVESIAAGDGPAAMGISTPAPI